MKNKIHTLSVSILCLALLLVACGPELSASRYSRTVPGAH